MVLEARGTHEENTMNPFNNFYNCTNCWKKYHHDLMMLTSNGVNHYCIKCYNLKENENAKKDTLQSNDHSKNKKVA